MTGERRQFRVLYRSFLLRFVDLDLLSSQGELNNLLIQAAAMLAALSFVLALFKTRQYSAATAKFSYAQVLTFAWGDQEFLLSTMMAIAGLLTVFMWNSLFPDRRDCLILSALPVRPRTIFAAKLAAIGAALGLGIVALNVFTGLAYPALVIPSGSGALGAIRSYGAYWIAMIAMALWIFSTMLAVQGVAMHLVRHYSFLRISSYLQLGAFFVVVGIYFLTPSLATPRALNDASNGLAYWLIPSFWFLGLYQQLTGAPGHPAFRWLADRALAALAISMSVAAGTYILAYGRHMRRVIEQAGLVPSDRTRPGSRSIKFVARFISKQPLEQALFLFITRTLARSRPHRLLLSVYCALGLALSLSYLGALLYHRDPTPWTQPSVPMLIVGPVLLFLTMIGIRFCFSLPVELRANWIFRLTETGTIEEYRRAIKRSLYFLAPAPVWLVSAVIYLSLWQRQLAIAHLVILALVSVLLVELLLKGFHKIPFTCSYLPGKANLKVTLGAYGLLFFSLADMLIRIELVSIVQAGRFVAVCAILAGTIYWAHSRPVPAYLEFEDAPKREIESLNLTSAPPVRMAVPKVRPAKSL